jgi:hypothetical protein
MGHPRFSNAPRPLSLRRLEEMRGRSGGDTLIAAMSKEKREKKKKKKKKALFSRRSAS